jgi:hypothetical protein
MACPQTWLEATQCAKESQHGVSAQTHKPPFIPLSRPTNPAPRPTPLNIHKLTLDEMVEHQIKGLCYNCDDKYFSGHKCKEHKFLVAISEDAFDSGNTHNFFHCHISQETHCYIHPLNNVDIMIDNGGSMKCGERSENVRLQIGQYNLKYHMFSIDMCGCDIVLSVEGLHTLGPISFSWCSLSFHSSHPRQSSSKCSPLSSSHFPKE